MTRPRISSRQLPGEHSTAIPDRLSAADRSSLADAYALHFPFNAFFLNVTIYNIRNKKLQGEFLGFSMKNPRITQEMVIYYSKTEEGRMHYGPHRQTLCEKRFALS